MVEVLAAVLILAIVVTAVLTSISFSQRTILSQSSQGEAAAQAQNLADALLAKLHGKTEAQAAAVAADTSDPNMVYVKPENFPDASKDKQFTFTTVRDDTSKIYSYRIKTAVYYTDSTGRKCVQMTAFAAKGGDDK